MTLSPAQQHVLDLMREGWELVYIVRLGRRSLIYKTWLRKVGEPLKTVCLSTFDSLRDKGLIKVEILDSECEIYKLSERGMK